MFNCQPGDILEYIPD
ncbi:MAG: hypothetical protein RJR37_10390 [Peptococcaceae bacterium MAG4]|nr:hypothetical protein [Peptococcaceae bacterium MAG4]